MDLATAKSLVAALMEEVERLRADAARQRRGSPEDLIDALEKKLAAVVDCGAGGCSLCHDADARMLVRYGRELARGGAGK